MGAVTPGETLGTLYNIRVGTNKTKQHTRVTGRPAGPHTMLMLHSALQCCAPFLECIQHSVRSKSLALKCTRHSVQLT